MEAAEHGRRAIHVDGLLATMPQASQAASSRAMLRRAPCLLGLLWIASVAAGCQSSGGNGAEPSAANTLGGAAGTGNGGSATGADGQGAGGTTGPGTPWLGGPLSFKFRVDWLAGGTTPSGVFSGGTEVLNLSTHDGALYAGVGYWKDDAGDDPSPGAQILKKDSSDGDWELEYGFGVEYLRVDELESIELTTSADGKALSPPLSMLMAGPSDAIPPFEVTVWTRDSQGEWHSLVIAQESKGVDSYVRSSVVHRDSVTGVDYLFVGTAGGQVLRGWYSPEHATGLAFDDAPELEGDQRVHALAVVDRVLYASIGVDSQDERLGGVYRRVDGPTASWELVHRWTPPFDGAKPGFRGLTKVETDAGPQVLGAREHPGIIERVSETGEVTEELDVRAWLQESWGGLGGSATLIAYNRFVPYRPPGAESDVLLAGLWANHPDEPGSINRQGSYFLVRSPDASYELIRIHDPEAPVPSGPGLRGTRALAVSPFTEDQGRVVYFGGFDAGGAGLKHNTAWIYRGTLSTEE